MSEHLTVGDVIDALQRFDRDRPVVTTNRVGSAYPVQAVQSIEPGGAVLFVEDLSGSYDVYTQEWRARA